MLRSDECSNAYISFFYPGLKKALAEEKGKTGKGGGHSFLTGSKIDQKILKSWEERKKELDQREENLKLEKERLDQLKQEIEDKLKSIKNIEKKIKLAIKIEDEINKAKLARLVKVYESMRPEAAAPLIEKMNEKIAVKILAGMKEKMTGKILAFIDPERAIKLSEQLLKCNM